MIFHSFTAFLPHMYSFSQAPMINLDLQTAVTGYTIFHKDSKSAFTTSDLGTVTSWNIPSAVLSETYSVKMTATNSRGDSAESGTVTKGKSVTILGGLVLCINCLRSTRA